MSEIVKDEPCPSCREMGRDTHGNHLIVFADGNKFCPKCKYTEMNGEVPVTGKKTTFTDTAQEFDEVKTYPIAALEDRGIAQDVCQHFGIHTSFDVETGKPDAYFYPFTVDGRIVAYKKRKLPKTFLSVGQKLKGCKIEFIGQSVCGGGKKLLICEGQDDALAAWQILKRYKPQYTPSVVSLPNGANMKAITDNKAFLDKYAEIIFCPDQDEAGTKAAKDIAQLLGSKVAIMSISEKDPNDMLLAGKQSEFIDAFFKAAAYIPDGLLTVEDVYTKACKMPEWGKLWPWPSLNDLTYGRHLGQGMYVGAAVKAGKTEWLSQMVHHIVEEEKGKCLLIKFEQSGDETVKAVAGKIMHKNFAVPDGDFTQEELTEGVNAVKGKIIMFNAYMSGESQANNMWDRLKPVIRHAVLVEGVQDVFIDPITQLTDGMTPSDTETELRRFSNEIAGLAMELGFFYYCFAHLKAPMTGKTHEEGGKVKVAQLRGSRAMVEKTKYALGIIRNQYADDPIERNTSKFHLLLNSGFGKTGTFDVFYNDKTGDYLEPNKEFGI